VEMNFGRVDVVFSLGRQGADMARRHIRWWVPGVVIGTLVVVIGPVMLPLERDPQNTPAPASTLPVTTTTSFTPDTSPDPVTTTEPPDSSEGQSGLLWTRIDPKTLTDVPALPLRLGEPGRAVFSPDGQFVVSFTYSGSDNSEELVVADLNRWEVRHRLPLEGWVAYDQSGVVEGPLQATFLDSGEVIAWIAQLPAENKSEPVANDYALFLYNLADTGVRLSYRFPTGFAPWEMRPLTGDRIAVFGSPVVFDEEAPDTARWPRVLIVDVKEGRLERDIEIPGLVAGHEWKGDSVGSFAHPGLGWDLDAGRLYIAHADHLAVTVVDIVEGELIEQREISLPSTWAERMTLWLLPAAQAKLQEGTRRNLRIDLEGERLYISGVRWELVHNDKGESIDEQQVALGLTVLDLPTLGVVSHLELPVSDVEISPDGNYLLLTGVSDGRVVDYEPEQSGLYVLDADTLKERGHLWAGTIPWIHTFSDQGQTVYVSTWDKHSRLIRLDLAELEVLAERDLDATEQTSFDLGPRGLTARWVEK
jgi:hypothetical protein